MLDSNTDKVTRYVRSGEGPILVFVHGYLGGSAQWDLQIQLFAPHFDVIAPELPGYGSSHAQLACDSISAYADQVLELLDQLDVTSFFLLGHSMGGMIVQQMTVHAPQRVRALICYGTGPHGLMPNRFEPIETSRQKLRDNGVADTAQQISTQWFSQGKLDPSYADAAALASEVSLDSALAGLSAMEAWDGAAALPTIQAPTLVLWGDQDKSYRWPQPEALWKGIDNAQLAVLPGYGHHVHLENPCLFQLVVLQFLQRLEPENSSSP